MIHPIFGDPRPSVNRPSPSRPFVAPPPHSPTSSSSSTTPFTPFLPQNPPSRPPLLSQLSSTKNNNPTNNEIIVSANSSSGSCCSSASLLIVKPPSSSSSSSSALTPSTASSDSSCSSSSSYSSRSSKKPKNHRHHHHPKLDVANNEEDCHLLKPEQTSTSIMSGSSCHSTTSSSTSPILTSPVTSSSLTRKHPHHHFNIPPALHLPPPTNQDDNCPVVINLDTANNDHPERYSRTISQETDTPVPTPPPPPNSTKIPPPLQHYYYPDPEEVVVEAGDQVVPGNLPDTPPCPPIPPPPPPITALHHHHHHFHHSGCAIHPDTVSIASSASITSGGSNSGSNSTHKRKRRHRDSKRSSRFRFSFRTSSTSSSSGSKNNSVSPSQMPFPTPTNSGDQLHHHHHVIYHNYPSPTAAGAAAQSFHHYNHDVMMEQAPQSTTATRASSITSSSDHHQMGMACKNWMLSGLNQDNKENNSCSSSQNNSSEQYPLNNNNNNNNNNSASITTATSVTTTTMMNNATNTPMPTTIINGNVHRDVHLSMKKSNGGLKSKKLKTLIHPLDRSIVGIFMLTIFFTILALLTGAPTVLFLLILLPIFIFLKKLFQCSFSSIPNHEPISSVDLYWLHKGHITHCLLYLDKGLSVQQLRDVIATRLLTKPELARFKSRLVYKGLCRSPYWKYEPEMDTVDEHVIEDDPIECKRTLRQRLMNFMSQSLPMDKPLWQIRYSTASYCDQVILIIRVHQTLSQSGLVSILTHYLCDSVPVCSAQKARFGSATLSINILRAIIVGPLTFFLWILWAFTRRHHNYLTKAKEIKSVHWSRLDLPKIYRIKQVTRSTLNDVLLASIAGSIRSYLTTKTNIINPPDLTVSIPVDIKPNSPIESSLIGVNYVLTSSPIPTNTEGAIPRLWEVRHLMEELKTSADTAVMYGSHYLLSRFLPSTIYRMLMDLVNRNSSVYMSNMIGPETWLSIGSHRLNKIHYFLSPPSYCSIVYNVFTYDNKLYISITTNSKLITNAKELMRQFRLQIDTLHELLSKRRVPGESKRAKRPMFLSDALQAGSTAHLYNQPSPLSAVVSVAATSEPRTPTSVPAGADLTDKLHEIQDELNQLSGAYEMGDPSVVQRYEELKEEFSTLLYELRRRKSLADCGASNIVINIENQEDDDNDGELRMVPPRRFSVVSIGRRASIVSAIPGASTSRVTPPILSRRSMATSPEPPSSPEVAFKVETEC